MAKYIYSEKDRNSNNTIKSESEGVTIFECEQCNHTTSVPNHIVERVSPDSDWFRCPGCGSTLPLPKPLERK